MSKRITHKRNSLMTTMIGAPISGRDIFNTQSYSQMQVYDYSKDIILPKQQAVKIAKPRPTNLVQTQ